VRSSERIEQAVACLDQKSSSAIERAWVQLRPLGFGVVPYLRASYPQFKHAEGRTALVYHATRYARIGEDAVALGIAALEDRSRQVRYRACGLLAYALRKDALLALRARLADPDQLVREAVAAAICAIEEGNHHRFVDRSNGGRSFWSVNAGDEQTESAPSVFARIRALWGIGKP